MHNPPPWEILFVVLALGIPFAKKATRLLRQRQVETWPVAQGKIELADAIESGGRHVRYDARLSYSMSVYGKLYSGEYKRAFETEQEAWKFAQRLKNVPVAVRYKQDDPKKSTLIDAELDRLLQALPPADMSYPHHNGIQFPRWHPSLKYGLYLLLMFAAVGFISSLVIHILAWYGRNPLGNYAFVLHGGVFVVWFPTVLLGKALTKGSRRDFWKQTLRGSPESMQKCFYGVFYASWLTMMGAFLFPQAFPHAANMEMLEFSATWMIFYSGAWVTIYSAMKLFFGPPTDNPAMPNFVRPIQ